MRRSSRPDGSPTNSQLSTHDRLSGTHTFDPRGLGGVLLAVNRMALAFTTLAVVACAGSLVVRFRRAGGVERQQLRWLALAAALVVPAAIVGLAGMALGSSEVLTWAVTAWLAGLPLAIGTAALRHRLYDLDRIVSRTLAYGCCSWVGATPRWRWGLASCWARTPAWSWPPPPWPRPGCSSRPAATSRPSSTALQSPLLRRRQDHRSFSAKLREEIDLDSLTGELLAVVEQTMQPTQTSLWLRPQPPARSAAAIMARQRT